MECALLDDSRLPRCIHAIYAEPLAAPELEDTAVHCTLHHGPGYVVVQLLSVACCVEAGEVADFPPSTPRDCREARDVDVGTHRGRAEGAHRNTTLQAVRRDCVEKGCLLHGEEASLIGPRGEPQVVSVPQCPKARVGQLGVEEEHVAAAAGGHELHRRLKRRAARSLLPGRRTKARQLLQERLELASAAAVRQVGAEGLRAAGHEGLLDVGDRDRARGAEAGLESVEVQRAVEGHDGDPGRRRLQKPQQRSQGPQHLGQQARLHRSLRCLDHKRDDGHSGQVVRVVAWSDVVYSAPLQLQSLGIVPAPPLAIQGIRMLVRNLVAMATEVASGCATVVQPSEVRVDVGFAPRATKWPRLAVVNERHWLLPRRQLSKRLAHHRYGHVRRVGRGWVRWHLVDARPDKLAGA
mmetsp:Transcript_40966/g.130163  ORF Transcript_40966/g.130163 Transcript_40966/m.130163 type:complete len:409 (+) Transcript_40966:1146-2372(+)